MVTIKYNQPLTSYNTFRMDVIASSFCTVRTLDEVQELIVSDKLAGKQLLILGGGSNLLFCKDFDGMVIHVQNSGIRVLREDEDEVFVRVAAGENWHEFVLWCLEKGYGGIENLSLIPGTVGSSPIQNIGAYGVEVKDVFDSAELIDLKSAILYPIDREACRFGYRDSIFKQELKGKVMVWSVTFKLLKNPLIQLEYGAIREELNRMGRLNPGIKDVSDAVCNIRRSKLPDPNETGNAGSFFKNPTISAERSLLLKTAFPGLVSYQLPDGNVKLAAGWLIEQCRWKGIRRGDAGVHPKQALCIVNYGNATGSEILELAEDIQQSVLEQFDVLLDMEVNVI
ncbi:MAG: UDP-N-acetylmuramate dehydrogenase [Bacteroidetes bacterium]|nr:UDP-N-acetylmuramate dehydrogenase [Bacteroidota bacterium]